MRDSLFSVPDVGVVWMSTVVGVMMFVFGTETDRTLLTGIDTSSLTG